MVTGGYDGSRRMAITEVLRVGDDSWNFVGNLPRAMSGMRIVIFGNRLLL